MEVDNQFSDVSYNDELGQPSLLGKIRNRIFLLEGRDIRVCSDPKLNKTTKLHDEATDLEELT